jgi:RNA polymerase sigma-70 factor (ECF subfamily)
LDDDAQLLKLSRTDPRAFRQLVERQGQYLYGVAHGLTSNAADAEDLVQETLLGAVKGTFRGESSVRTWLVKILVNQAAMLRRARSRRPESRLDEAKSPVSASGSGAGKVDAKLDLTAMLDQLSVEHRQIIVLRELEGLSYEEMAAALGVPRGTVESRLHRAREELRRRFKGYEP